jgi:hypothetical protein
MANIYSAKFSGSKHWDDPTAWEGGVVPGPSDHAYIQSGFTAINDGSGIRPWDGKIDTIRVDSTSGFPTTSGSFYTYTYVTGRKIKIDYDTIDGDDYFVSCSIDHSYVSWSADHSGSIQGDTTYGTLLNNTPVIRTDHTHIYLSGSSEWHVNRVTVQDHAVFTVKDNATIALDSDLQDSYIYVLDAEVNILDNVTAILTGSTERNSSLIHFSNNSYATLNISGSSDLRTRTSVSSTVAEKSGIIPVADSTGFAAGDIISVYSTDEVHAQITPDHTSNSDYVPYYYTPTGSVFPYYRSHITEDKDETLQVTAVNGNNLVVSKMFPYEGEIVSSENSVNRRSFQKSHGRAKSRFTGTKTTINVNSKNNQFKAGDKVTIGNSVYTVLEAADVLVPVKTIDFENGANLDDFWVDEYIGSGSTNEIKTNSGLVTGSRLEMSGSLVGTSNYYKALYLKDTYLRDCKVTLTGTVIRASDSNFDTNRMFGVTINEDVHNRDRVTPFYQRYGYSRAAFIGLFAEDLMYSTGGRSDYYTRADGDILNDSDQISSGAREGDVEIQIDALRENLTFYYQGVEMGKGLNANRRGGAVAIHLRREGTSIKKLIVEEYVQKLVLDTSDSFSNGTKVYLSGTEVEHPAGQKIVKLASSITDIRGYKNIPRDYHKNLNLTDCVVPVLWSNNGNQNRYRNSSTTSDRARIDSIFSDINHYDYYFRTDANGNSYFDLNLGQEVTLDAVGIQFYHTLPSHYIGQYIKNFGVEYSTDGHNWTVAKERADDTRLSSQEGDYRIFQFTEITARFLRFNVGGASNTTENRIMAIGIYRFNGRGSTIELNNTSDIGVGDTIAFFNPRGIRAGGYTSVRLNGSYRASIKAGSTTADDYVGKASLLYQVTAKTGNIITLDRLVEGQEIHEDTLIVKMNRSITVKSQAGTGNTIPFGLFYSDSASNPGIISIKNVAALSLGDNSRERNYFYRHSYLSLMEIFNCSLYYIHPQSPTFNNSGHVRKNNTWINLSSMPNRGSRTYSDHKASGEIISAQNYQFKGNFANHSYYTGNIIDAGRYVYVNYHSTPQSISEYSLNIRGNYIQFMDWMSYEIGFNNGEEAAPKVFNYYDNIERQSGYPRPQGNHPMTYTGKPNLNQGSRTYPQVKEEGFRWFNDCNLHYYSTLGRDHHTRDIFYNAEYVSRRPYLLDDRSVIIQNPDFKNQYDIIPFYQNRPEAVYLSAYFHIDSEQEIRVQHNTTYKNDLGTYYDEYLGGLTSSNKHFRCLLIYENRTVVGRTMPLSLDFTTSTFDETITAKPGYYLYVMLGRTRNSGTRVMTFKNMNFAVSGNTPNDITILNNSFDHYKLFKNPQKMNLGSMFTKQKAVKKSATRSTVKLRKFRF